MFETIDFTGATMQLSPRQAFPRYGKGRHPRR
ncbi:hypothetical protein X741_03560 [Mesorhizobium sp. LNHC229A00]|nr:hypothetical protein X741_03560 [Mesorhizobium sp. LNHC229A00]